VRRIVFSLALCVSPFTLAAENPLRIINDGIPTPLTATPGDAERGRAIVANKQVSMCLLCHQAPTANNTEDKFQGTIATNLAGAGARWTEAQLRLRIVDSRRVNRDSIMPAYFRTERLTRVHPQWRDKTILDAQQIEDVVAYLVTLK
jgi:L-cysteine S-thiosulfotransferase